MPLMPLLSSNEELIGFWDRTLKAPCLSFSREERIEIDNPCNVCLFRSIRTRIYSNCLIQTVASFDELLTDNDLEAIDDRF